MAVSSKYYVHQGTLENALLELFPHEHITKNARKSTGIVNPLTGSFLELDVWLPNLHLSFEFQDPHHYASDEWDSFQDVDQIQLRDQIKQEKAISAGEDIIMVPCWWDGDAASLAATTRFYRPDLLCETKDKKKKDEEKRKEKEEKEEKKREENEENEDEDVAPIPLNPPWNLFSEDRIPVIGSMMLATFPVSLSVLSFDELFADSFWWMGEKYDGIRFCWIPAAKAVYTRSGTSIQLPITFSSLFGNSLLDGEIWFGRGYFQESQLLVRGAENITWAQFRALAFDVPTPWGRKGMSFEKRYAKLLASLPPAHPFLTLAVRMKCGDARQLAKSSKMIIEDCGEGVILRKPKSLYQHGRSSDILKIKATRGDLEGLVVEIHDQTIHVQLPDGEITKIEEETGIEIKRGDIVTFSFESYSRRALPTEARIIRVRKDITWSNVLRTHQTDHSRFMQEELTRVPKPFGYWNIDRQEKAKILMLKFAKNNNFDHLVPENWYAVEKSHLYAFQDVQSMLQAYGSSHIKVLQIIFPDINLEENKFSHVTTNYWQKEDNRRKFFLKVAKEMRFDPLVPKNWSSLSRADLLEHKGARAVLSYYPTLREALVHLFPEINFDNKFRSKKPANFWQNAPNVRNILEKYAKTHNFDPHIAKNWYNVDIRKDKELQLVIVRYSAGSLSRALKLVYPQLKWDDFAFRRVSRFYWADTKKQRNYFEGYARKRGLDPLVPATWYSTFAQINTKEARTITSQYKKNIVTTLVNLFPDIGLDRSKFGSGTNLLWQTSRKGNM